MSTESRTRSEVTERNALSCLMQDPSLLRVHSLELSHFSMETYRQLFSLLSDLEEEGRTLDPASLFREASERKISLRSYEDFEDLFYLAPSTANFPEYFRKLDELRLIRTLTLKGREIEDRVKRGESPDDILRALKSTVDTLTKDLTDTTTERIDPSHLLADVLSLHRGEKGFGFTTGWPSLDPYFKIYPNYLTLITGIPGHGKTAWTDALLMNLAVIHGWRSIIFSAEYQPIEDHLAAHLELYSGSPFYPGPHYRIQEEEIRTGLEFIGKHFHFLDPQIPTLDRILDLAELEFRERGANVLVIDPWNEIQHSYGSLSETLYISECLRKIRRFARKHGIHVFMIAHPQKLQKNEFGEYPVPTPYDISGGANWRNKADNCITVYRQIKNGIESPETEIHIGKVKLRKFGKIGMVPLSFDRLTGRYHSLDTFNHD